MSVRGWVLFAAMSVIWGVPYLMIKVAVEGVSAPVLVLARTGIAAVILLPLALRAGRPTWLRRRWRWMVAFAVIEIMAPWYLLSEAERHLTSSMTGLLIAASPILAVIVERLTGDAERLRPARYAGLAIGFAGVAVLAGPELRGGDPVAIVQVLLTALCYAIGPLILARRLGDVPALPLTAVCLSFAAVAYAPAAALTWPDQMPQGRVLAALFGLATICTALAFLVFFALIREVGASRALVFTYVNPAVAVAAGVLILSEPLTVPILVAFGLILGGSLLASASRSRAPAPETARDSTDTSDSSATEREAHSRSVSDT